MPDFNKTMLYTVFAVLLMAWLLEVCTVGTKECIVILSRKGKLKIEEYIKMLNINRGIMAAQRL